MQDNNAAAVLPEKGVLPAIALDDRTRVAARRTDGFSRDEMNLAEFPLAVLSTRVDSSVKTLEFRDTTRLPSGELIERKWIITGADKFGLPTSTDDDVILGLIRLSMDQGFRDRKIYFTRYELLKTLHWSTEGRSYTRLIKSLDRLSGVRLRSTNSFYDNATKSYQTCNFGIIDAYEINNERHSGKDESEAPKSYFVWSEAIFNSFKAGFIKKLDLSLYFSLKSAVSRRLYRYLDKHFYYRSSIEMPLMVLAFEKIGLSRTYRYVSSIKQQLEPAAKELVQAGFLADYGFTGRGEAASVRFVAARTGTALPVQPEQQIRPAPPQAAGVCCPQAERLCEELIQRGIAAAQARRLSTGRSDGDYRQISGIISYYDFLLANNDRRVSRNPAGFLYRAVESPYKFTVPSSFMQQGASGEGRTRISAAAAGRPELKVFRSSRNRRPAQASVQQPGTAGQDGHEVNLEREYRRYCTKEVNRALCRMPAEERSALQSSVQHRVSSLGAVLDEVRFKQVVESALHEEVRRLWGIPDFSTWLIQYSQQSMGQSLV